MSALRIALGPVPVLPGASEHILRWDAVEEDTRRAAFSVIYDDRLESFTDAYNKVSALVKTFNEGSAT